MTCQTRRSWATPVIEARRIRAATSVGRNLAARACRKGGAVKRTGARFGVSDHRPAGKARHPDSVDTRHSQAGRSRIEAEINLIGPGATGLLLPWVASLLPADALAGTCKCGAPPAGSCPWCPSTVRGSLARSARDARFPWRRHTGALARRPATPGSASGSRARNRASRCTRSRRGRGTCWSGRRRPSPS